MVLQQICKREHVRFVSPAGSLPLSDLATWLDAQLKLLRVKGQAEDSLVIY